MHIWKSGGTNEFKRKKVTKSKKSLYEQATTFRYSQFHKRLSPKRGLWVRCTQPYPCDNKKVVFDKTLDNTHDLQVYS